MKYLDLDLYDKICVAEPDPADLKKWNKQYTKWLVSFERIQKDFPPEFNAIFKKHHFHDFRVLDIQLSLDIEKNFYILKLDLESNNNVYQLSFFKVSSFKSDFDTVRYNSFNWLLCEILSLKNCKTIEILFSDGTLTFEFQNVQLKSKNQEHRAPGQSGHGSLIDGN